MKFKRSLVALFLLMVLAACSEAKVSTGEIDQTEKTVEVDNEVKQPEEVEEQQIIEEQVIQEPQYTINPANFNVDPMEDAPANVVLLTVDDAPDKYALEMAKTLKALNVKAIFFVNGHFLDTPEEKAILKAIYEMGFEIGNHTMTHSNLKKLSEETQYREIVELSNLVEKITGERPKFFRAPFGANTEYSKQLVLEEKMVLMNWTYGYDFMEGYMSREAITDIMVNTSLLHNGANLLMHDREWTNEALADIVNGLQEKGYTFVDPQLIETIK